MHSAALLHGWPGLMWGFAAVQGPLLAGLWRGRAPARSWLAAPLVAAPVTVAAGLGMAALAPWLQGLGAGAGSVLQLASGATLAALLGYGTGRVMARSATAGPRAGWRRGALVAEPAAAAPSRANDATRGRARQCGARRHPRRSAGAVCG